MTRAKDMDVLVERTFDGRRMPERDEVEVVDMRLGRVLDLHLLIDLVASQQAEARQFAAVVRADAQVAVGQIDDAEVVAAPDQVSLEVAIAGKVDGDVLSRNVGRHVLESGPENGIAIGSHLGYDQAGSGFKADLGDAILAARHQAQRDHRHAHGDGAVAAHVRVHAAVHVDQPGIEFAA
ncbi:hypothetical protein D3C86_518390 [compost metagenome]